MGDLSFFGVLQLRLGASAAPNSAQDDGTFLSPLHTSDKFALVVKSLRFTADV
jgi:hypothetical protein